MAEAEPTTAALPPVRRLGAPTMLAYGFGAVAYGVKDFGFLTFLLLFYSQVVGLPAQQVGFVIMCALLLDAFIDPAIGWFSDHTRSRWGRRHPWMYGAAIPIALAWLLLWNPPAWSHSGLLLWLFVTAVLVRTAVSAFEVPSQALSPELTADYDERTRIMAYRYLFGWAGGMAMMIVALEWLLAPGPGQEAGQFSRGGYPGFAIASAVAMVFAILVSAIGTHHEIGRLPRPEVRKAPRGERWRLFRETIANRPFLTLMAAGFCYYWAQGISFTLSQLLYAHVWQFPKGAYALAAGALMVGATLAFLVAPRVASRFGKPASAAGFMALAAVLLGSPYLLRLAGLFPPVESPWALPLLFSIFLINATCSVSSTILGASMMADVVEHSEVTTGQRSEGIFFAGAFFIQKCCSGLGIFGASLIMFVAGFPDGARPGTVPAPTIDRLTLLFAAAYLLLGFAAAFLYRRFPFGKAEHQARVERLAKAA
jgi:GPH family glycoside/pentoside/hexuronide:cation symporter